MSENLLEQIRERAYAIWECKGKPEGQELDHWLLAEQELTQELANESQIDATEITEEREYLREMEDATNHETATAEAPPSPRKKAASVRP